MAYTPDTPLDLSNPDDWAYYSAGVRSKESGGDINAQNPNSSANGLYQFTKSSRDKYAAGKDWNDPSVQEDAMKAYTADSAKALASAGHEPTARNLYLAHFLGAGGGPKVLGADPSADVSAYVDPAALTANKSVLGGKTVQDVLNWAGGRFGGPAPTGGTEGSPPATSGGGAGQSSSIGPGVLSPTAPPQAPPSAMGGLYDALTGGPGALSAVGSDGLGPVQRFGQGLTGIGAALMARDNPQGAAVLQSGLNSERRNAQEMAQLAMHRQQFAQNLQYKNLQGQYLQKRMDALDTKGDQAENLPPKLFPQFQTTVQGVQKSMDLDTRFADLQNQLATGQFSVRMDQQGKYVVQNLTDNSTKAAEMSKNMTATINSALEDVMNANKGAGSKWKADMAKASIIPAGGEWDSGNSLSALDRIRQLNTERYEGYRASLGQMEQQYPGIGKQSRDGSYAKTFDNFESARDKKDNEVVKPAIEQFHKNKEAKASGLSPAEQIKRLYKPQ